MRFKSKKFYSLLLAGAMTITTAFSGYSPKVTSAAVGSSYVDTVKAVDTQSTDVAQVNEYGLADSVGEGVILHCWNWSFNAIKSEMANIAAAGYTAVQTSPVQRPKDGTAGDTQNNWWKVYQPTTICFAPDGHVWFGTKDDFKAMCDEADKYGIKVIVDVVVNHMANNKQSTNHEFGTVRSNISSQIDRSIRDDDSCWHMMSDPQEVNYTYGNRGNSSNSITRGSVGSRKDGSWPDLNTGSTKVQNAVLDLLKECIDLGADGFRFDAAKHIELPTDSDGSYFWPTVLGGANDYASNRGTTLYNYGEILDSAGTSISNYTKYMAVTDNGAGNGTRGCVNSGNASGAANSSLNHDGQKAKDIVLWAESHDTYADGSKGSGDVSQSNINKTWAIVASRNFPSLYLVRPGSYSAKMGAESSNKSWKNKEVAAVNKFHNFYAGKSEYMGYDGSIVYDVRNKDGVVLVNVGGNSTSVNFSLAKTGMKDGEYKDQVTGNKFTVSSGNISGQIGDTGIAVVYNSTVPDQPQAISSAANGTKFTDSLDVTISLRNATSGTYKIDDGSATTFTSAKTITLGENTAEGSSVKLTLTATNGKATTTNTYTYYKRAPGLTYTAWLKKPSSWGSTVYCYAYDDSSSPTVKNAKWPGVKMTLDSETGNYKYEIPSDIESPKVIFNDNNKQVPGAQEPGFVFTCPSMIYENGEWKEYETTGKVVVKYVDKDGKSIADDVTLTGDVGKSYTTTAKEISGYKLDTTPSNATGKYTSSTITVKYVYSKVSGPDVTSSLADGSSFKTETTKIKLTLSNATSGTYKIDNGITKSFTDSVEVKIGEGKIADSNVSVEVTATKGTKTTKKTFTYKKVFNGTVNETTTNAAAVVDTGVATATLSNSSLDSQYKTKVSKESKTITVDGNISDWSSDMLIAQGAANDDPRVYRPNSMYEVPIDLYALYATYDNSNLYLMWEMTNVQDVVAPNDNYPLTQGFLYNGFTLPIFIAIDTRDNTTKIGNDCKTAKGGTLWDKPITYKQNVNKIVATFTDGSKNFIYGGDSTGVNPVELCNTKNSGIVMKWGKGILSSKVMGIDKAYGSYNGRVVGDMTKGATYVDFNKKGHNSASMDFHYEMSIPLEKLGTTYSQVKTNGLGVELIATMGNSGMDCLPYDVTMNDRADLDDSKGSQENNSFEKSDDDVLTVPMGSLVKEAGGQVIGDELELNFGADRSAPQAAGTALKLLGKASGGSGKYTKYQYYVNGSLIATKTSEVAVAWTPSAAGKYVIKCVVTDSEGKKVTSSKYFTVEGGEVLTGLQLIGGSLYYYTEAGVMKTDYFYNKDGNRYYFGSDGKAITGLKKCSNGYIYYFQGAKGVATGLKTVNGAIYYFNPSSGAALAGWRTIDGNTYYFDNATRKGYTGLKTIDGAFYCFAETGVMKVSYFYNKDGERYYFGSDGKAITGLKKCGNGYIYYFQGAKGVAKGLKTVNGDIYYFNPSSGAALADWRTIDGNKYYFDNTTRKGYKGLKTIDGAFYYFTETGVMKTDYFYNKDGNRYYFGSDGKAITGLKKCSNGYMYYFQGAKGVAKGLKTINGYKYFFNKNTGAAADSWVTVSGNMYYFDKTTKRAYTGVHVIDGITYRFGSDGVLIVNIV